MLRATAALSLALALAGVTACKANDSASSEPTAGAIPPSSPAAPLQLPEPDAGGDDTDEPDAEPSALAAMTLPPRPDWMDKYAGQSPDERFFDIAGLMQAHDLPRDRAVELQNHFRDLTRAQPHGNRNAQYTEALRRAEAGEFEDRRDTERLATAPFIVVFDLDETLLDQYIDPAIAPTCHDITYRPEGSGKDRFIKLTPGWDDAIRRIHALGGAVVLFSANVDVLCYDNAARWMLDGKPILEHPAIAGFMSNSHLVLQPKQAGAPVVEPSKDLRIVDPELTRAIIVDDNPLRLFQFRNTRIFKKFKAEPYCTTKDPAAKKAYDRALAEVVDELEDSLRYAKAHPGTSFVDAYLPYSALGQHAMRWLQTGAGKSQAKAVEHLRKHPELVDAKY